MPISSMIKLSQAAKQPSGNVYEDKTLGLAVGVLNGAHIARATLPDAYDEFFIIIDGSLDIKSSNTAITKSITAGNSCVIPQSFNGESQPQEGLCKYYVLCEQQVSPNTMTNDLIYIDENSDIAWQNTSDGHRKKVLYQNQSFTAGVWQSEALKTGLIKFPYHEFIFINNGSLICSDEAGITHNFNQGDALFIPQGTLCAWQVKDSVSIHFAQVKSVSKAL